MTLSLILSLIACDPSVIDMEGSDTGDRGVGDGTPEGDVLITPAALSFGEVGLGCEREEEIAIQNVGDADLSVDAASLTGDAALSLSLDGSLPAVLAPGESLTGAVTFTPDAEGVASAALLVESDDPDQSTAAANVDGEGAGIEDMSAGWLQTSIHPADVVLAVDTSCSMMDDVTNMVSSVNAFLEVMRTAGADARFAAVVADDGCVAGDQPYIDMEESDGDARAILQAMLAGSAGDNVERAFTQFESAWDAADRGVCNEGLFEGGRQVHLVGLSDEGEQSAHSYAHYVDLFQGSFDDAQFHAIGGPPPNGCDGSSYYSGMYEAVEATGGAFLSICEQMEYNLTDLAQAVVSRTLQDSFELSGEVDPDSVRVEVDDEQTEVGWRYDADSNAVLFDADAVPGIGSAVEVRWSSALTCD